MSVAQHNGFETVSEAGLAGFEEPLAEVLLLAPDMAARSTEDVREFEKLFRAQKNRLMSFVRKHMRNPDTTQDIVQHTFMEAYRCWHKFRGDSRPETWLCGIALNLVRNNITRSPEYRYTFEDLEDIEGQTFDEEYVADPLELALREESVEAIRTAIEQLPRSMRVVVSMIALEGMSYQETAEELDIPIGTVRSRLSRAREHLKALCD